MRSTGSNDVIFDHVIVPDGNRLPQAPGLPAGDLGPWNLIGSAVYLGIATAARDFAVDFAKNRRPTALRVAGRSPNCKPCSTGWRKWILRCWKRIRCSMALPNWPSGCRKTGNRSVGDSRRRNTSSTNNAIAVTDQAMRVVGSVGLFRSNPLERYFRDVRAGTRQSTDGRCRAHHDRQSGIGRGIASPSSRPAPIVIPTEVEGPLVLPKRALRSETSTGVVQDLRVLKEEVQHADRNRPYRHRRQ